MSDNKTIGRKFEVWSEGLFNHFGYNVQRDVTYVIRNRKKPVTKVQVDLQFNERKYLRKNLYVMELKYSSNWLVSEEAVKQLVRGSEILNRHLKVPVHPFAVVTNKTYTKEARDHAERHGIKLYDTDDLLALHRMKKSLDGFGHLVLRRSHDSRVSLIEKEIARTKLKPSHYKSHFVSIYI